MTLEKAEQLVEALENAGYEASVYRGYSGRGMYGSKTEGIVLASSSQMERAFADCPDLKGLRRDSLGRGVILY